MRPQEFTARFDTIGRLLPDGVPAYLSQRERLCLYSLVYGLAPAYALELGMARGGSAAIISGALDDIGTGGILVCLEPQVENVDAEMLGVIAHNSRVFTGFFPQDMPATVDGRSSEGLFEFCFYDADHTREGVEAHLTVLPHWIAPGGFIVCHDGYNGQQGPAITAAAKKVGLIDCGMLTRCANDVSDPGELYGGMRLLKKPGELAPNS